MIEYLSNIKYTERNGLNKNDLELIESAEHIYHDVKDGFVSINKFDDPFFHKLKNH